MCARVVDAAWWQCRGQGRRTLAWPPVVLDRHKPGAAEPGSAVVCLCVLLCTSPCLAFSSPALADAGFWCRALDAKCGGLRRDKQDLDKDARRAEANFQRAQGAIRKHVR